MKTVDTDLYQQRTADRVEYIQTAPRKPSPGEIKAIEAQIDILKQRKSFLPKQIDVLRKELDTIPRQIDALQRQLQSLRSNR